MREENKQIGESDIALIHKNTFDIVGCCEEGQEDEYFEVDENIALVISNLNKKGYKTTFCCSGYAFKDIFEMSAHNKKIFDQMMIPGLKVIGRDGERYVAIAAQNVRNCYIMFENDYDFKNLPEGFSYIADEKRIGRDFCCETDTYELIFEIVESMKALYEWTEELEVCEM